ncbi:SPW repeat protein [Paractinoplanes rishiriensis]|uniref:SPW repeat-containing integral membrane domain-containing protein n=1 Tax=Paractinoplanes rishiriensis TaxID=1050105 RepID=A0A919K5D1_9ACTN|nr:SPW repeat protein [Actinoplanes rishiriensis]GIF01207.1 hypothetical protein Ari01nite_86710 [Actinoplanes rishiriensis]
MPPVAPVTTETLRRVASVMIGSSVLAYPRPAAYPGPGGPSTMSGCRDKPTTQCDGLPHPGYETEINLVSDGLTRAGNADRFRLPKEGVAMYPGTRNAPAKRPDPAERDTTMPADIRAAAAAYGGRTPAHAPAAIIPSALVFLAGIWLIIAPFSLDYRNAGGGFDGYWNDVVIGVALAVVALVRIALPLATAPLSLINILLGFWLITAPFVLAYNTGTDATQATLNDIVTGAVVAALAAISWLAARQHERAEIRQPHQT